MDFCTPYFGTSITQLTFTHISNFFAQDRQETDQLEFKSYAGTLQPSTYKALHTSVNAFLNSKGGLLVWGAPIGVTPAGSQSKIFAGALTIIGQVLDKDALISRLSDSQVPLPAGIRAAVLTDDAGACVCAIEVDESEYSPHFFDERCYMRLDGQTKSAPPHYIEALFRKIRIPTFEGFIKILYINEAYNQTHIHVRISVMLFNFSPLQNVDVPIYRVLLENGEAMDNFMNEIVRVDNDIVHFGMPFRRTHQFLVVKPPPGETADVEIVLNFGAKNTPAKMSSYTIRLSRQGNNVVNPDNVVINRKENRLLKDIQDEIGSTRETQLMSLLGRVP